MNSVESPEHYQIRIYGLPIECIEVIEALGLDKDLFLGSAFQYLWRAGKKDPTKKLEDLKKALWYLARRIDQLQFEEDQNSRVIDEDDIPF